MRILAVFNKSLWLLAYSRLVCGKWYQNEPAPIVIWHGMGDTCCDNSTMGSVIATIEDELPGVYVHSIKLGSTESSDRNAGFLGNLNTQIDQVCEDLADIKELQNGVNMMGFSQGGLFLRALIQRCPSLKTKTLVTFGSPHGGISRIPECSSDSDFMCNWMRRLASRGVYSWYVRDHVVQAQYFKDPERIDQYLKYNMFLPDINSDLGEANDDYRKRITALEKVVLIRFSDDNLISPAVSSWFGFVDSDGQDVPLQNTTLYSEDRLGLRELDASQRLDFVTLNGKHMNIGEKELRSIVSRYFSSGQKPDSRQKVMFVQGEYL